MNTQTLEQTKEQLRQLEVKLEDLQLVSNNILILNDCLT